MGNLNTWGSTRCPWDKNLIQVGGTTRNMLLCKLGTVCNRKLSDYDNWTRGINRYPSSNYQMCQGVLQATRHQNLLPLDLSVFLGTLRFIKHQSTVSAYSF